MEVQLSLLPQPEIIQKAQQAINAAEMRFDGAEYKPKEDDLRLSGQILRIFNAMKDGKWRTLNEIAYVTRDPQASISAQLRNLRKARLGGHTINKRHRGEPADGLYEYQLIPNRGQQ